MTFDKKLGIPIYDPDELDGQCQVCTHTGWVHERWTAIKGRRKIPRIGKCEESDCACEGFE